MYIIASTKPKFIELQRESIKIIDFNTTWSVINRLIHKRISKALKDLENIVNIDLMQNW